MADAGFFNMTSSSGPDGFFNTTRRFCNPHDVGHEGLFNTTHGFGILLTAPCQMPSCPNLSQCDETSCDWRRYVFRYDDCGDPCHAAANDNDAAEFMVNLYADNEQACDSAHTCMLRFCQERRRNAHLVICGSTPNATKPKRQWLLA